MQYFKGDADELKMYSIASELLDDVSLQKDLLLAGAGSTGPLGDVIWTDDRSPLTNAITLNVFRIGFKEIFDSFVEVGTFESYITVFKKIFGDSVVIDFTVPAPGKLNIDIEAQDVELVNFMSRYIQNNQYIFDNVVDENGDQICFQFIQGFQSQYELEQMLYEMVPAGIFTQITLTLGA